MKEHYSSDRRRNTALTKIKFVASKKFESLTLKPSYKAVLIKASISFLITVIYILNKSPLSLMKNDSFLPTLFLLGLKTEGYLQGRLNYCLNLNLCLMTPAD